MKMILVTAGICAAAAAIGLAAQNRRFDGSGPPGSRLASTLDADHDGTISAAEMRAATSALKSLDANGDGRLTVDEFGPAFGPGGPRGRGEGPFGGRGGRGEGREGAPSASADDLTETLMAFDSNGDGKLDRSEVPERFQGLFDRADTNKDGALTKDELKQSANASVQDEGGRGRRGGREGREFGPGGRGNAFVDPLLRALDADGDGSLSAAEIAGAPDALKSLDANHDGQLSADEFRPAFGRGRGDRGGRDGSRR